MSTPLKPKVGGVAIFIASACAVFSLSINVDAASRRVHSSDCHYFGADFSGIYNGAYLSNNNTSSRGIYCPAPTDSYFPHTAVARLNVHGYEPANESNYSRACVKHYNNAGTACGSIKYWGTGYAGGGAVDISTWTANPYSFPYVYNLIDSGGRLYGFFMAN